MSTTRMSISDHGKQRRTLDSKPSMSIERKSTVRVPSPSRRISSKWPTHCIDAFGLAPVAALSAAPSRKVKVPSFPLATTLAARPSTQCGTSWHDRRALMAAWYCFCGSKHTPSQPMQTSKKTVFEIVTASFVPMSTYRPRSCPAKKLRYSSQSCQNCEKPGCFEAVKTLRHRS